MCGIIGCVGRGDETLDTLVHGLSKLEYRGYDSAGVALANNHLDLCKHSGKIADLREALSDRTLSGSVAGFYSPAQDRIVIVVPEGETLRISEATLVHELTHVGQYDARGSVYIPGALHAQSEYGSSGGVGSGSAYDFERNGPLPAQRSRGRTMADLNYEAQAQLCEYYYVNCRGSRSGGPAAASCSDFQPWLDDLDRGRF